MHILGLPTDIFNVYPATIKFKTYQAVSYTHLDVYKRQVHAYSCYQSENNSFLCLLKRVIDLIVLNHYILHDNNCLLYTSDTTLDKISSNGNNIQEITDVVDVVVLKKDKAQSLSDTLSYTCLLYTSRCV